MHGAATEPDGCHRPEGGGAVRVRCCGARQRGSAQASSDLMGGMYDTNYQQTASPSSLAHARFIKGVRLVGKKPPLNSLNFMPLRHSSIFAVRLQPNR